MGDNFSESQLVNAVIRHCWYERAWLYVDRANAGFRSYIDKETNERQKFRGKKAGTPDIEGFFAPHGRYLGIECKIKGRKQEDSQIIFEQNVKSKGGEYWLIYDLDQLDSQLQRIKPV